MKGKYYFEHEQNKTRACKHNSVDSLRHSSNCRQRVTTLQNPAHTRIPCSSHKKLLTFPSTALISPSLQCRCNVLCVAQN